MCHIVCFQSCVEAFCQDGNRIGELDNILQAAIEFDIHQVIKDSRLNINPYSIHMLCVEYS